MKKAVKHLEQFLEKAEGYTKGKVVLATVYGDVHDIGKSLVNTILSNNGYTVFDLGKQVPVNTIIDKAVEVGADAIGLSALLVSTSKQMPLCVQELDKRGIADPGADRRRGDQPPLRPARAVRRGRARRTTSGVFYCKDAFEGLETMDALQDAEHARGVRREDCSTTRATTCSCTRRSARTSRSGDRRRRAQRRRARTTRSRRAPFFGTRVLRDIPLDEVFELLDLDELYPPAVGRARLGRAVRGDGARRVRADARSA